MRLLFTPQGWEDYRHWQRTDRALVKRMNRLLDDALPDPAGGIGKSEPLEYGVAGAPQPRPALAKRLFEARHAFEQHSTAGSRAAC